MRRARDRRLVGWSFFLVFAFVHLTAFILTKPSQKRTPEAPAPSRDHGSSSLKTDVSSSSLRSEIPSETHGAGILMNPSLPGRQTARILPIEAH